MQIYIYIFVYVYYVFVCMRRERNRGERGVRRSTFSWNFEFVVSYRTDTLGENMCRLYHLFS